jgi:NADH-quinone oxidoreductase subunit L
VVLAVGSIAAGWVGWPQSMGGSNQFERFLAPAVEMKVTHVVGFATRDGQRVAVELPPPEPARSGAEAKELSNSQELGLAAISVFAASLGLFFAWLLYYKRPELPDRITARIHGIYLMVLHKYYVDEGYGAIFVKPLLALSTIVFWKGIDQGVIDGMVNGAGEASKGIGNELRRMQSGNIRSYAAWVAAGGAAVIAYMLWWGIHQ